MKVPPKRKGNSIGFIDKGKSGGIALNESPSEKEGKFEEWLGDRWDLNDPSMKVPPKRKGNTPKFWKWVTCWNPLNESPSEKEGK